MNSSMSWKVVIIFVTRHFFIDCKPVVPMDKKL
ncbi:MAG: hypothetical protein JWR61_1861 [Ferruginibacter sp.]|nr:hypothetical protein [Ferruginibacter sp.]